MKHPLLALLLLSPCLAQTTAPTIPSLIKDLSSDNYQTRQDAQDQLVRFGQDAKSPLQQFLAAATDPEARTRAESALAVIEENRATGPSLVSLHLKDARPDAVLKELARQSLSPIPTFPDNLFKQDQMQHLAITLDADREPFWTVFRKFCDAAGVRPNTMGPDRKFVLMQGGDESLTGPAVFTGPFMVVANSVTRSSSINFARDKTPNRNLSLQFSVFAEPKLNVLGHDWYLRLSEATDDHGNSLVVPAPPQSSMGADTSSRWTVGAALTSPPNVGTRLVRVRGINRAMVQTKSESWEIPDPLSAPPAVAKSIAGRRYQIDEFKAEPNDSYHVKFTMTREGPPTNDWRQNGRGVHVYALDVDGKMLQAGGLSGGGSDEHLTYVQNFSRDDNAGGKLGPPVKLVVDVPTEVKEVDIPFELTDLPLP